MDKAKVENKKSVGQNVKAGMGAISDKANDIVSFIKKKVFESGQTFNQAFRSWGKENKNGDVDVNKKEGKKNENKQGNVQELDK